MNIKKLTSENVKRLSIVEIVPSGSLVTIGGKNGAGKSSVLDSIAYVLGGDKLVPTQPIRTGEAAASIKLDLGDYVVTRKFSRERIPVTNAAGEILTDAMIPKDTPIQFGPTKSTLVVTNPEGAKYPSPQALLDKLYGKLTFDPLAFSKEKDAAQNEILRRLVGLDFTQTDANRKIIFDQRAIDKKTLAIAEGRLNNMPKHASAKGGYNIVELPLNEITDEVAKGRSLMKSAEEARSSVAALQREGQTLARAHEEQLRNIASLERQLVAAKDILALHDAAIKKNHGDDVAAQAHAAQAEAAVPDFEVLDKRLRDIDASNRAARENKLFLAQEQEVKNYQIKIAEGTKTIENLDTIKDTMLREAKFPVKGLSLTDDGVTFEGLPLQEVAASVQLRVSIAIGLALNPTLKVLLIRNGNLLDDDSLKLVAQQAEDAGAQVWMEYVTSTADGVSVMLEDGHVA